LELRQQEEKTQTRQAQKCLIQVGKLVYIIHSNSDTGYEIGLPQNACNHQKYKRQSGKRGVQVEWTP